MIFTFWAVALVGCGTQPSPLPTPTATKIAQAPSPTSTPSPTETPTPAPTGTPTSTPTKTPTPRPTATPTPEIQRVVYLEDNFTGTNKAVFEGPNPHFEDDALFFTFPENGGWLGARAAIPMSKFRLEARLSGDGVYGLNFGGFRLGGEINYDLILLEDGHLVLNRLQGEEYKGEIFKKKVTSASGVEGFHDFGLDYDGEKLVLFFDGEEVGEVSESLPEAGRIGLFVWNQGEKDVEVGIDYLSIKLPAELIPTPTPPTPEPTETPRPPEQVFCPAIPEGFVPRGGPPEDYVHEVRPSVTGAYDFRYGIYAMLSGGEINDDGSFTAEISFNYQGVGPIKARYYVPPHISKYLLINGEVFMGDKKPIFPNQMCIGDIVIITSKISADALDPRVPPADPEKGKELDGAFYVMRYRQ